MPSSWPGLQAPERATRSQGHYCLGCSRTRYKRHPFGHAAGSELICERDTFAPQPARHPLPASLGILLPDESCAMLTTRMPAVADPRRIEAVTVRAAIALACPRRPPAIVFFRGMLAATLDRLVVKLHLKRELLAAATRRAAWSSLAAEAIAGAVLT